MTDVTQMVERLRASVRFDALNGTHEERSVCRKQMTEAAALIESQARELERWRVECGPLLDFLTGTSALCGSPVDYAKELSETIDSQARELAALRRVVPRLVAVLKAWDAFHRSGTFTWDVWDEAERTVRGANADVTRSAPCTGELIALTQVALAATEEVT